MIKGFVFLDVMINWDRIKVAFFFKNNLSFYYIQQINLVDSIIHRLEIYTL